MLKLGRRARRHFMMLTNISVHVITCISEQISSGLLLNFSVEIPLMKTQILRNS